MTPFGLLGLPDKNVCPILKAVCIEGRCKWWKHVVGKNPQTGRDVDEYDCAISWLPVLMLEVAQKEFQTGAAVESLRNEAVKAAREISVGALAQAMAQILSGPGPALPTLPDGKS